MKYILLLMIVFIIASKLNTIKNLLKTETQRKEEFLNIHKKFDDLCGKEVGKDMLIGFGLIFGLLLCGMYFFFYLLSMIYVNNIWFSLISVILILFTLKNLLTYAKDPNKFGDVNYMSRFSFKDSIKQIFNVIYSFAYIGYLLYFIITHWQ